MTIKVRSGDSTERTAVIGGGQINLDQLESALRDAASVEDCAVIPAKRRTAEQNLWPTSFLRCLCVQIESRA